MRAHTGDRIRLRARGTGAKDRLGTVVGTRGVNGEAPFIVRWEGADRTCFFQPGVDAEIIHAEPGDGEWGSTTPDNGGARPDG